MRGKRAKAIRRLAMTMTPAGWPLVAYDEVQLPAKLGQDFRGQVKRIVPIQRILTRESLRHLLHDFRDNVAARLSTQALCRLAYPKRMGVHCG